ncbi:MAG: peptidylprolyl isomerase [bacterium]
MMNLQKSLKSAFTLLICSSLFLYACHSSPTPGKEGNNGSQSTPPVTSTKEKGEEKVQPQPTSGQSGNPEDVVAKVNGVNIYRKELDRTFSAHVNQNQNMEGKLPPEQVQQLQQIILDRLIESELLCQKGQELNITVPDEEILARIEQFKKQFSTEAEFEEKLKENKITLEELKKELKRNMIISRVIQQQMANQTSSEPAASEEELKKYYDAHKDQFKQEEMIQASHILVKVEKDADEATKKAAKEKITDILKKVKAGEDFAKLAKENSDCPSSQNGGDLGFFTRKQMVPEFSQAAFSLKVGEVSDIIETPFGYHIIKVTNSKPEAETSFEESKARIKQYLSGKQRSDAVRTFIQSLREKADIQSLLPKPQAPETPAMPPAMPGTNKPPGHP